MKTNLVFACAAGILGAFAIGCGPTYDRTDVSGSVGSSLGGSVDGAHAEVPVGMVVKAHIISKNTDDEDVSGGVRSDDPSVMDVVRVDTANDWAFIGRRVGRTRVSILVDGATVQVLDAIVTEQRPLP